MAILVTGGIGYIGSHTTVELLDKGEEVIVLDNFSNSKPDVIDKIKQITKKNLKFYKVDLLDIIELEKIFKENNVEAVIHFAGLKSVGESLQKPVMYYRNNIVGTINLIEIMNKYNCNKIIFSSSATVYGDTNEIPIKESNKVGKVINPYGRTKYMIEEILKDVNIANNNFKVTLLRYFNPIGAHASGLIGDNPNGIPSNIMPYIAKVATEELDILKVFGNDYNTVDGTGVRDYIHVVDLSKGHVAALNKLREEQCGVEVYNLGTGKGYSVLELIKSFEKVTNKKINYEIVGRREGDVAICYANANKAEEELNWVASKNIDDMCRDTWNFMKNIY